MSFNPELIKVSKSNDKYSNLVHGKDTITFGLKDCYSHFGLTFNKKFKNYSIGINIKDKLFSRLKAVEAQVTRNEYSSNIAFSGTAICYIMYILTQRLASKYKFEHSYKI